MKLFSFRGIMSIALGLILGLLTACSPTGANKPTLVTTLFPLYDFARILGGEAVDVSFLLPPGVESHSYEPTPRDLVSIEQAGLFVFTGEAMEPWAVKVAEKARAGKTLVVDASKGIEMAKEAEDHEESTLPWEWSGSFDLKPGTYIWSFAQVDGAYADPAMLLAIVGLKTGMKEGLVAVEDQVKALYQSTPKAIPAGSTLLVKEGIHQLTFDQKSQVSQFTFQVNQPGTYGVFTQHVPSEFEAKEHYFKDNLGADVEPVAQEPEGHQHHHGGVDPHIWLDPVLAQVMVTNIEQALVKLLPEQAGVIAGRAKALREELQALDRDYAAAAAAFKIKTLVYGGHFAFGYLAKRYGLDHVSPYPGFSPDTEPSPQRIAALLETLKSKGLKTIFYEELIEPRVAKVIADQTGAKMELLHGAHNLTEEERKAGLTYVKIMLENLKKLIAAQSGL